MVDARQHHRHHAEARGHAEHEAILALLGVGYFLLPKGGAVYDVWYLCVGASSVAAIVLGVHLNTTRAAGAWYLIALGQLFFVAGDTVFLVYTLLGQETPYPSVADLLYLAGYPALGAGLLWMIRLRSPGRDTPSLIDATIATSMRLDLIR